MALGIAGILCALVILVVLCIKRVNLVIASVVAVVALCVFGGLNFYTELTTDYTAGLASFIQSWVLVFFLGSVFGKIMDETGAAQAVADTILSRFGEKSALFVLPIVICLMVYGGVSGFVVVFTIWPMMDKIWRKLDAPRRLMPAMVQFAAGTACNGGPGAPSALNLVTTGALGVAASAGLLIGMVGNVVVMGLGILCFYWATGRAKKRGEHYLAPGAQDFVVEVNERARENAPNGWLSLLPLIVTVVALNIKAGGAAVFKTEVAMALGALVLIVLNLRRMDMGQLSKTLGDCVPQAITICASYGAITGFGNVVRAMPVFQMIVDNIPNIPGSPLVSLVIATNVMCAITGTATGAATLVAPVLGTIYTGMGIPAETVARVICFSATGFDSVPHNSGIINYVYTFGHENFKTAYPMIFLTSAVCPLIATVVMIVLAMFLGIAG